MDGAKAERFDAERVLRPAPRSRSTLRSGTARGDDLLDRAVDALAEARPDLSARRLPTAGGPVILLVLVTLGIAAFAGAAPALLASLLVAATFALCVLARLTIALLSDPERRSRERGRTPPAAGTEAPVYSVLVALYDEAGQVRGLVNSLARLDWPRERREVVLVCEGDDHATLAAIAAHGLPQGFRVVRVPPHPLRTKPKALAYALPLTFGDLVVVYDAEDRPDPLQLREAWAAFHAGGDRLACLQAPLHIDNSADGWLPALFAAEYSALFDGLLPALASEGGPVPLGGTSNHFRRDHLDVVGGWDPWNVTEDADLGVRFARFGFAVGTLARQTDEEAPVTLVPWLKQRTRWFKGWMQTWLVHMRAPGRLRRELGTRRFALFHLFVSGMILSALVHPFLLATLAFSFVRWAVWGLGELSPLDRVLTAVNAASIALGYVAFALTAWRTLPIRGLAHLRSWLPLVPVYWVLMSVAAWRAAWQLHRAPNLWEKTPHGATRRRR